MKKFVKKTGRSAVKGRSAALVITLVVHAAFFLVAGTYVALEVIERQEARFEAKKIARPQIKLKKLQVPVKIEQSMKQQTPKLSQRMTAASSVQTKSVDFQLPELTGFGGRSDVSVAGGGFGGSLGFATTQLNVFGLKSTGEKIVFLLDTGANMLIDEVGGIPAYTIIKQELLDLIGSLPPTALFNVVLFDMNSAQAFSREMSPASDANIEEIKAWLDPLNSSKNQTGFSTLSSQGTPLRFEPAFPIMNTQKGWLSGLSYAIQKGADSVYWLGAQDWIMDIHEDLYAEVKRGKPLAHPSGWPPGSRGLDYESYPGGKERWNELVAEARKQFEAENKQRREDGRPLKVLPRLGGGYELVQEYFPGKPLIKHIQQNTFYNYTGADLIDYIETMLEKYTAEDPRSAAIGIKKRDFCFNVIHFVPQSGTDTVAGEPFERLRAAAREFDGRYIQVKGLDAIQSAAAGTGN